MDPIGKKIRSPGGSFVYEIQGPVCILYDREQLPWPCCSLQWRGKQPSWNRLVAILQQSDSNPVTTLRRSLPYSPSSLALVNPAATCDSLTVALGQLMFLSPPQASLWVKQLAP